MDRPISESDQTSAATAGERAERLREEMPSEVRLVLRRKLDVMHPINGIKGIGRHFDGKAWSITPYPDALGSFGTVGARNAKLFLDLHRGGDD